MSCGTYYKEVCDFSGGSLRGPTASSPRLMPSLVSTPPIVKRCEGASKEGGGQATGVLFWACRWGVLVSD